MKVGLINQVWAKAALGDAECLNAALEDAILADELGYSSIWFGEHHTGRGKAFYGRCSHPEILISRLIGATKTIRLGTGVKLLPLDEPKRFAETLMMLNLLAPDRIDVGVGMGMRSKKASAFHDKEDDFIHRLSALRDYIDVSAVSDDRVIPWCKYDLVPNLWVATREQKSLKFAAQNRMNLVVGQLESATQQKKYINFFRQHSTVGSVRGVRFVHVCEDSKSVWPILKEAVARMYSKRKTSAYGLEALNENRISHEDSDDPQIQLDECFFIAGTPEIVLRKLTEYISASGVDSLDLIMHVPEIDREEIRRSMSLFSDEVLPHLHSINGNTEEVLRDAVTF